jgi:hypothetical protein
VAVEKTSIQVPTGDHSLVETTRLNELERISQIAEVFGITAQTQINLASIFRIYCTRLSLSHSDIERIGKISRTTLRTIEDGTALTIQERTAIKLKAALGNEFDQKIRALGFVK